ncbi:thioredoxin family protein [Thermoleophilum album]|uniref:thioredoxin family protein n=1 Tax=Thermoleophilum album TaxID=29539 RepID=UPI00115FD359|nr:thioredoxin family protein [Thermoleophilum album]
MPRARLLVRRRPREARQTNDPRAPRHVRWAAPLFLVAVLAGCGGGSDRSTSGPPRVAFPAAASRTLDEVARLARPSRLELAPAGVVLERGRQRFGFALIDPQRGPRFGVPAAIYLAAPGGRALGPFPAREESLAVDPAFRSEETARDRDVARSVQVAYPRFPSPGRYRALALAEVNGRLVATRPTELRVLAKSPVPEVGERAIRVHTPTLADVRGNVRAIETRTPPDGMHKDDLYDVIGRRPVLLVFATPALCQSRVCGPVVDLAEQLRARRGSEAAFIHMEIYRDNDPSKGLRPQVRAWRLPSEPWVFAIDRRGRIAARIEGAASYRELERALAAAVRGAP